jgi:hypothetical protein
VPAGVRVAYYEFQPTDNLKKVVAEVYGTNSLRAIHDFLGQTRWDPNRWPPPPLEHKQRLIVPLDARFEDEAFTPLDLSSTRTLDNAALVQQLNQRTASGIFPLRRQAYATVYRVIADDFNLTARQVSRLLYAHEDEYLQIARQAGFDDIIGATADPPQDVRLFGRSFDVVVDYERELFPAAPPEVDKETGKRTTRLLNGAVIEEWPLKQGNSGLLRQVTLPSGYRKVLYRPDSTTMLVGQVLHSLVTLGRSGGNPQVYRDAEGRFISRLVWDFGRSLPHRDGEVLDYGRLVAVPVGEGETALEQVIEVATRPGEDNPLRSLPFYRPWLNSPFMLGVAAVIIALLVLGTFGWIARRA